MFMLHLSSKVTSFSRRPGYRTPDGHWARLNTRESEPTFRRYFSSAVTYSARFTMARAW